MATLTVIRIGLVWLAFAGPSRALADDDQQLAQPIQEFFIANSVHPQDRGEWQTTLTVDFAKRHGSSAHVSGQVEYGVTDRLQVQATYPYQVFTDEPGEHRGFGKLGLGVGYTLLSTTDPFALSTALELDLPTGHSGEAISIDPSITAAKTFGPIQVHVGLQGELSRSERQLFYNVAAVYSLHPFYPTCELNGATGGGGDGHTLYATPGLYRRIAEHTEIGLGVPFGITASAAPYGSIMKLTMEW